MIGNTKRIFRNLLLFAGLFLSAISFAQAKDGAGFSLVYETKQGQQEYLDRFFDGIEKIMPDKMKAGIQRKITVRFSGLSSGNIVPSCGTEEANSTAAPSDQILGKLDKTFFQSLSETNVIEVNEKFLEEIAKGPEHSISFSCGHRNMYRLAQATILHELAHAYDYSDLWAPAERAELLHCRAVSPRNTVPPSAHCQELLQIRGQVSDRAFFRNRVEWKRGWFRAEFKNHLLARSPDPYEFTNPQESYAVNFEYFMLDPEYACRRPVLQDLYETVFASRGAAVNSSCEKNNIVRLASQGFPISLDPSRVYAIHYLLADAGEEMMSRWGHSMFRVVVCAPERKVPSAECLKDTAYHIVVSYRANTSDVIVNYLDGLTGKYPSQVFFLPLTQVVDEYTRGELRDVKSYDLHLNEKQRNLFLQFVTQQYWDYVGRYYFITNNCASEARDVLDAVLPTEHPFLSKAMLTPVGMRDVLTETGLIDESSLADLESARLAGLYFPSNSIGLEKSMNTIRGIMKQKITGEEKSLLSESARDFLKHTDAQGRADLYAKCLSLLGSDLPADAHKKLAAAFYSLEAQEHRIMEHAFETAGSDLVEKNTDSFVIKSMQDLQGELLPWKMIEEKQAAYGIPRPEELLSSDQVVQKYSALWKSFASFEEWIKRALPDITTELDKVSENMKFFAKELRSI